MNVIFVSNPPKKREKRRRLTPLLKSIKPGQTVVLDAATARCLYNFIRYNGGDAVQKRLGPDEVQVWSLLI